METENRSPLFGRILRRLSLGLPKAALVYIVVFTVAAYLAKMHPFFELTAHFRLQYLIGSIVVAAMLAVWRAWRAVAVALVCATLNAASVLPLYFSPETAGASPPQRSLRLLLSNVLTSNTQRTALIELARAEQPDLLIVQEVSEEWVKDLNILRDQLPHSIAEPRDDNFGIAVYSRIPFVEAKVVTLIDASLPSILARINLNGQTVSILTTHPTPPVGSYELFFLRNAQLREAATLMRQTPEPKLLIGDLNTTVWSPYFSQLTRESGLRDGRRGFGVIPTWPADFRTPLLRIPIDHCLVSPDIRVVNIGAGPRIGSDHLPLIVDLAIPAKL
ncbi:MAG: endonuclease/exonuclease/phosphatase family protein [Blastocatellales bacterium]